jgi:hypothetical protein
MVISGLPRIPVRQAWSSGSAFDPGRHHQDGRAVGCDVGEGSQVIERRLVSPVHVLDRKQNERAGAGGAHQRCHGVAHATAARRDVHGIVQRPQLDRLRQVQKIAQIHAPVRERRIGVDDAVERRLAGCGIAAALQPEETAHQRPDRVLSGRRAEVQDQTRVGGETPRRCPALKLLQQAGLADPGLAADVDGLPRAAL